MYPGCRRFSSMRKATPGASPARDVSGPREVRDPMHARKHLARNPGGPAVGPAPSARSAQRIPREYDCDERRREVGLADSTGEASEQRPRKATVRGGGGGKRPGQGESGTAYPILDTVPGSSATRVGPVRPAGYEELSARHAFVPEAGAQCGNSARWDLCGGRPARAVPTATEAGREGRVHRLRRLDGWRGMGRMGRKGRIGRVGRIGQVGRRGRRRWG